MELHGAVVDRAGDVAAHGLILTGSTARSRRTPISDLDYHLTGQRLFTHDLSSQLDLHTMTPGLIVFDDGHLTAMHTTVAVQTPT